MKFSPSSYLACLARASAAVPAIAAVFLCACSSRPEPSTPAPAAKSQSKTGAATAEAPAAASPAPESIFTVNQGTRDPFFPKAKKAAASESSPQPMVALDIPALLQASFQGVISSGDKGIAIINNVMLEPGRSAVIPIHAEGQHREVAVQCREVSRDSVLLEVQGYPELVRIVSRSLVGKN